MKNSDKNCKEEILELLRSTGREGIEDVIGTWSLGAFSLLRRRLVIT